MDNKASVDGGRRVLNIDATDYCPGGTSPTMSAPNNEISPNTYEILQGQSSANVPNWNMPVPAYRQDAFPPPPAYNTAPSTQVWAVPTVVPQWSVAGVVAPNTQTSPPFYQTFLKAKPKALGIVLIVSAIIEIALGIALVCTQISTTVFIGIPFWGSIFYIISGSLTIAARSKPNICLVRGSLALNIISSLFSIIAVILNIVDLAIIRCYYNGNYYGDDYRCEGELNGAYTLLSICFLINLLIFCVSLSISIFGCRSLSNESSNAPQVLLIQNDVVVSMSSSGVPATFPGFAQPFPSANVPPTPYGFQEVKARPLS
ncbi:membrane-spanning 4-domains subfamily A member 4D-like [Rhinoderma darwinii]|uniref:membrane-spanning 4-domains subfamily A member 4D-like n=1 Tax=Rhinoderma darwinii TaxID=43563 RepID=UPI003F678F04